MPRCRFAFGRRTKTWGGVEDLYALLGLKPTDKTPNDLVKAAATLILDLPALDETERSAFDETVQQIGETDANLAAQCTAALKRMAYSTKQYGTLPNGLEEYLKRLRVSADDAKRLRAYNKSASALVQFAVFGVYALHGIDSVWQQKINKMILEAKKRNAYEFEAQITLRIFAILFEARNNVAANFDAPRQMSGLSTVQLLKAKQDILAMQETKEILDIPEGVLTIKDILKIAIDAGKSGLVEAIKKGGPYMLVGLAVDVSFDALLATMLDNINAELARRP